ncbi:unnamed protein product [Ixodes pacificus]
MFTRERFTGVHEYTSAPTVREFLPFLLTSKSTRFIKLEISGGSRDISLSFTLNLRNFVRRKRPCKRGKNVLKMRRKPSGAVRLSEHGTVGEERSRRGHARSLNLPGAGL